MFCVAVWLGEVGSEMRIIRDLELARSTLSRRSPFELYEPSAEQTVERIIADVRSRGDAALFHYSEKIDGVELAQLEVSKEEVANAYNKVDKGLISALELARERIRSFHLAQRRNSRQRFKEGGLEQLVRPLHRVGIYAPGGTACYPSTVLMMSIPAKVAGVEEVILATPPREGGTVPPLTLVAAELAEVDRIFKIGGAQAIAALAFGTETVPRVDKVCGPGNLFVVLAKKMVYGAVDIDGLQGPSEVVIVADDTADPVLCAADLLAQAEHDPLAAAFLITTSPRLAEEVNREIERQLAGLPRQAIAAESLEKRGGILVVVNMDEAIELVNLYAPEHVSLIISQPRSYVDKIRDAGAIFLGGGSPVVFGDYIAGPSHVLPTGGTARFSSPLGVDDFLKVTNVVARDASAEELAAAAAIARAEGLDAHARAADLRRKQP